MDRAEDRASLEATRWLVELHEAPDDREVRRRFEAWRRASPLNEAAWSETERLTAVAATMPHAYADVWQPAIARRRTANRRATSRSWRLGAAAMALAACVAFFVVPSLVQRLQADYTTATAELRKVVLQDGSEVTLAPDSAIAVSFEVASRQVRLLSGEAFFEVRPDISRPFRVLADTVETTVVGTAFDVRLSSDGVVVSVEHGIVRVGAAGASARDELQAGQAVRVTSDGETSRQPASPETVAAWRDGQLVAQNVPLRDAVDQLRRSFAGSIVLTSASLGERRITGAYNLADPEDALRAIAQAHGGRVRRVTPWLLVVSDS
jgi:transmembrane sensor